MKYALPLLILAALGSSLNAATVNFSAGGGPDTVLFETTLGTELVGGTLFAGTFASDPVAVGLSRNDIIGNYQVFDTLDTVSGAFGNFSGNFSANVGTTLGGKKIYLIATDTASIETANEIAIFSSSDASWSFPGDDNSAPPSSITLVGMVDDFVLGMSDSLDDPGGGAISGTFNTIQLAAIPEPGSVSLILLGALLALRRRRC